MIEVHLYGRLRKFSPNSKATDISKIETTYVVGETLKHCIERLGINIDATGEIFINHRLSELNEVIPRDQSRLGIFPNNMKLIDGALYLRYCGYNSNIT